MNSFHSRACWFKQIEENLHLDLELNVGFLPSHFN